MTTRRRFFGLLAAAPVAAVVPVTCADAAATPAAPKPRGVSAEQMAVILRRLVRANPHIFRGTNLDTVSPPASVVRSPGPSKEHQSR